VERAGVLAVVVKGALCVDVTRGGEEEGVSVLPITGEPSLRYGMTAVSLSWSQEIEMQIYSCFH
jgi:hypothetical protein